MIKLQSPENKATVSLRSEGQQKFFEQRHIRFVAGQPDEIPIIVEKEATHEDFSVPAPVKLTWSDDSETSLELYRITISESIDMHDPMIKYTNACNIDIYNLCIGTRYYWTVQKNDVASEIYSFETALLTPRSIKIDGVTNVRDLGGYRVPGGRIRQKMLYRGASVLGITDEGVKVLLSLGIKNEVELRFEHAGPDDHSVLEKHGIILRKYPIYACGGCFSEPPKPYIRKFFELLADESNYPIYFHCAAGADRTGTMAFLVEALLGVYYKDMRDDYELTSISASGTRLRTDQGVIDGLAALEELCTGQTWHDICMDYLTRLVGVPASTINKVRDILIE